MIYKNYNPIFRNNKWDLLVWLGKFASYPAQGLRSDFEVGSDILLWNL